MAGATGFVGRAEATVTSLTVRCGPAPTASALTAEACGPWSAKRTYVQWFVTTVGPSLLGPPIVTFPTAVSLPPEQRCSITGVNPTIGFGDGVSTQQCQAQHGGVAWVPATPAQVTVRVDETPPTVTPTPSRPPDVNGWYNAPVTITWAGADTGSGVAGCSAPVAYAGPDTAGAPLSGTCTDNVGRVSVPGQSLVRYDATPPTLTKVTARAAGGRVTLAWSASPDTASVSVRRANRRTGRSSVIFTGLGTTLIDRNVLATGRYAYTVTAVDQAGVAASSKVKINVTSPLQPAAGTRLRSARVVLSWPTVRTATYYNVQLFIGGRKVLSTWPTTNSLRIPASWRFQGRINKLPRRGTVQWYVWPAMGPLESPRFGKLIGTSSFRLRR